MITDFTPEQQAKLDGFSGWEEFTTEQPNVARISEGHYWDSFTVNMLLRDELDEFYFFNQTRESMQTLWEVIENDSLTEEEREEQAAPLRQRLAECFNAPSDYGVCDTPEQVLEKWPSLLTDENRFVILFTEITRKDNPGWRWHKNGEYIGTQNPEYEHIGDEKDIERVLMFSIVRLK